MKIRLGVTGHRFLVEVERVTQGIDQALSRLMQAYSNPELLVYSSLSEGADRLAAVRALKYPGTQLIVPLPFHQDEYLKDFPSPGSKEEFLRLLKIALVIHLPPQPDRVSAYAAAGQYMLENSDVLLAVWDGLESQGKGGTGWVVEQARQRKLPLLWVQAGNRQAGTQQPTSLGEKQGKVIYERLG